MFSTVIFTKVLTDLLLKGKKTKAEEMLLNAYSELKRAGSVSDLEYVISGLAHFYSMPESEDLKKAEAYFHEREMLSPGAYTTLQTAMFYFYLLKDSAKTLRKTNEITHQQD